jgi:hypothetical protein
MPKWDYLFIVVDDAHGNFGGVPRYVNGQELPDWKQGPNIFAVMNHLLWQGWEPVPFSLGYPIKRELVQLPMIYRRPKE